MWESAWFSGADTSADPRLSGAAMMKRQLRRVSVRTSRKTGSKRRTIPCLLH
jgi:hypothetical protein